MLLTRCPSCHTTFRITAEALQKAGGQVRCGRCAAVFNAHNELREEPAPSEAPTPPPTAAPSSGTQAAAPPVAPHTPAQQEPASPQPAAVAPLAHSPKPSAAPASGREAASGESPFGDLSVAELVAQVERGGDSDAIGSGGDESAAAPAMSAVEVDAVLDEPPLGGMPAQPVDWLAPEQRRSRWWHAAAAVALVALALQAVHHFRNDLAMHATIGPLLQDAYGALGFPLSPRWDLAQYQILDWVAAAEPNASGRGSLRISARVQNRGPRAQPYPYIHLQLEDRWQASVGSRVFRPSEYLETRPRRDALMAPGATARAELEVLDPGPDAYGFELDVCIEIDSALRCGADQIFK